ncbi:hypothetical protein A2954_00055 [Candidatus Roizmanbacteria bacterium RIFCSPLOWO2_01_FULL_37_12]|uniref:Plasmid stabilization protein n=1 Tax=Candidatus Roizmanbacteria bacterium RIFCSPLOWO2_01_FULL_37_12 TaxID=1802056 RepID=A0A1F7IBE2_9BACT|nr:MAG: hypothetical protein A3D76_00380 [Candidatus Roizmanbacteria bacterium RIFCSPHIGHO2_02_FULL_37_9b]OGK40676.1 MAG: hypothetical protein A2954_00055 [Candidatus Roizmanbacteria bacterium RIFCSPLOWO2_01_FULL_37_12]
MSYKIFYSQEAEKYLGRLTSSKAKSILERITYVAGDPFKPDNNITKLTGTISSYRLRIGDLRVIYELDVKDKLMYVVKIKPRGSAYL